MMNGYLYWLVYGYVNEKGRWVLYNPPQYVKQ